MGATQHLLHADVERGTRDGDTSLLPGWVLVPLTTRSDGQRVPVVKWAGITEQSADDRAGLARLPHDAWAVLTGPSGLYVIDLDRGHVEGVDGIRSWVDLLGETGHPEWNPRVLGATPRGGRHLYYAAPDDPTLSTSSTDPTTGIDAKGRGGMATVTGPGRALIVHQWEFPPVPAPWLDRVRRQRDERDAHARAVQERARRFEVHADDTTTLSRKIDALQAAARNLASQGEGNRNALLHWTARVPAAEAVQAGADLDTVRDVLEAAALACGLRVDEARATIRSGLADGGLR